MSGRYFGSNHKVQASLIGTRIPPWSTDLQSVLDSPHGNEVLGEELESYYGYPYSTGPSFNPLDNQIKPSNQTITVFSEPFAFSQGLFTDIYTKS